MLRPALILFAASLISSLTSAQNATTDQSLSGTHSIGDAIRAQGAAPQSAANPAAHIRIRGLTSLAIQTSTPPIHILYVHGINQVGPNDSAMLRKAICRYVGECTVNRLERIYAEGPFALNNPPPPFAYLGRRIWNTPEDWSASAPFIDRYEISGGSHMSILLDELNWWPIVYPFKCKALIAPDAHLTGPSKTQIDICNASTGGTQPDPAHPGRFLEYQWMPDAEATALLHLHRHATFINRSLKNSLMDWGFGDAVLALGPLQQILTSAIRELLIQSLQTSGIDPATARPNDAGPEFFFITHSLGSYLSLAALDPDSPAANQLAGPSAAASLPQFALSPDQKTAAAYFSAHTAGFYFLANQIELLELAHLTIEQQPPAPCPVAIPSASDTAPAPTAQSTPPTTSASSATTPAAVSISSWQCRRQMYLDQRNQQQHGPNLLGPQIVSWSDPDDLLSWNVPQIPPVRVVNLHVHNRAFKIPPIIVSPVGAHANYAENPKVLRVIFKPTPSS